MFKLSFCWRNDMPVEVSEIRMDKSEHANRVSFSGIIGNMDQTPNELHSDLAKERKDWREVAFTRDDNGRLKGRAVITTIGVYPYLNADGSVRWELRHPEDVYDEKSLKTLELLPLTNDHPDEMITPATVSSLQDGQLGEFVLVDAINGTITNTVVVSTEKAIMDVENGKRALSCGYKCDLEEFSGNWNGVPYTHRQRNIRYNHCSIVDSGRAGDAAKMKFDHFDGFQTDLVKEEITVVKTDDNNFEEEGNMPNETTLDLRGVKVDGVDYKAEPAVISALHAATTKLDSVSAMEETIATLKKDNAVLASERDALQESKDSLEEKLKNAVQLDELDEMFDSRKKLDAAVELAGIEDAAKMDTTAKMEAVVLKASPKAKELLDARKDTAEYGVYLKGRFDAAVGALTVEHGDLSQNLAAASGANFDRKDSLDTEDSRRDAILDAWKPHRKEGK